MSLVAGIPDWEPARVVKLRDEAALLLHARSSTSPDYGLLPLDIAGMKSIVQDLGLARLGRSANLRSIPTTTSVATLSGGGVVICDTHRGYWYSARWIDPADSIDIEVGTDSTLAIVMIGGKLKSDRSILSTVKEAATRGMAGAGRVSVQDYRIPGGSKFSGRYSFTDARGAAAEIPESDSVVLCDLNVLVDMYRALNGESQPPHFEAVRDTIAWLRCTDFRPGFAIGEAASNAESSKGGATPRDLAAAVNAWFDTPQGDLTWQNLKAAFDESRLQEDDQSDLKNLAKLVIDMNYLALLRLAILWQPLDGKPLVPRDRVTAYAGWVNYFNRPELGFSGYPHELAHQLLLGDNASSTNAARLIRSPPDQVRRKLRGSAWDLYYPHVLDTASTGGVEGVGSRSAYLMTADRPLTFIRQSVATSLAFRTSNSALTYLESHAVVSKRFSEEQLEEISQLNEAIRRGAQQRIVGRMIAHSALDVEFVSKCIADSELEFNVANSAGE